MPRQWTLASKFERCGHCYREIAPDDPMQVIHLAGVHGPNGKKLRCERCADGPVSWEEIEAAREAARTRGTAQSEGFTRVGETTPPAFDRKAAAAGRDD